MRGVPGTTCRIGCDFWHGELPVEGDFLRTRAGSCYKIEEWRPSRPGSRRLGTFVCTRLEKDAVELGQEGVFEIVWANRTRGQPRYHR